MVKRLSFYLLGLWIATLGIGLCIQSGWGTGSLEAAFVGANNQFPLTVGTWSILIQIVMVAFAAWMNKKRPAYESAIAVIIRGVMLDFWLVGIFPHLSFQMDWESRLLLFGFGVFCLGFGVGMYLIPKLPKTPLDTMITALEERYGWSMHRSRLAVQVTFILIALCLAGPVGIGTLGVTLMMSPIASHSFHLLEKVYERM